MAEPSIVAPVIFGVNAPGGVGVVGSKAAGTPTLTTNPETAANTAAFQSGFTSIVQNLYPPLQDMDGINYYITSQIAAIIGQGIPNWFSTISYNQNAFVSYNGLIYVSLTNDNLNNNPASLGTNWTFAASPSSGANSIYNGSMSVAQAATSGTISGGTPAYTVDGFIVGSTGNNTGWEQSTLSNNQNGIFLVPSGTLTDLYIKQRIESTQMQTIGYQNVTFQALVKNNTGSTITPTLAVNVAGSADNYSSPVSALGATNLQSIANGVTTVVSYTFAVSSSFNFQYGMEVILDFGASVPSGESVGITNFAVNPTPYSSIGLNGNPPTFSAGSIATELIKCMRYYQLWDFTGGSTVYPIFGNGFTEGTTNGYVSIPISTPMFGTPAIDATFTTPTAFDALPIGGGAQQVSSFGTLYALQNSVTVLVNTGGSWTENVGLLMTPHSSSKCVFAISSRL